MAVAWQVGVSAECTEADRKQAGLLLVLDRNAHLPLLGLSIRGRVRGGTCESEIRGDYEAE